MKKLKTFSILLMGLLILLTLTTSVYASDPVILNIDNVRPFSDDDGDGEINDIYSITQDTVPQTIFKIGERETETTLNFSKVLYCLRLGLGFGDSTREILSTDTEYSKYANFKTEADRIIEYYNEIGYEIDGTYTYTEDGVEYQFTPYNAILWISDNMCLINDTTTLEDEAIQKLLEDAGIENSLLTIDDIDVIAQNALWHFSNYGEFLLPSQSIGNLLKLNDEEITNNDRIKHIEKLYNYLVNTAKKNASSYGTGNIRPQETIDEPTVELDETLTSIIIEKNFTIGNEQNSYFVVGPFKANITGQEFWDINIDATFGYKSSNTQNDYTPINDALLITIEDGVVTEYGYDISEGGEFYVAIDSSTIEEAILEFILQINYDYSRLDKAVTLWTATKEDQPVLLIEDETIEGNGTDNLVVDNRRPDFSLRKYITEIERNGSTVEIDSRVPNIDIDTVLTEGTATYKHRKNPVEVETGDKVTYTIAVYNEGSIDGKVTTIVDYLPTGIVFDVQSNPEFIAAKETYTEDELATYKYSYQIENNKLIIGLLEDYTLAAFSETGLSSKEIQIVCLVNEVQSSTDKILTNIAEITGYEVEGNLEDRDSTPYNFDMPSDLSAYWGKTGNTSENPGSANPESYYAGQEDDDDFEKVLIKGVNFDLSLRKFISSVKRNGEEVLENIDSRIPAVDVRPLENGTTASYSHDKNAVVVKTGDIIIYTIRVYNEGDCAGYVESITDHIPEGLEFILESEINQNYMWQYLSATNMDSISTSYWSKARTDNEMVDGLIKPYSEETLDYVDVQIEFRVIAPNTYTDEIVNIAEITSSVGVNEDNEILTDVADRDSIRPVDLTNYILRPAPENSTYQEDDDDYERVQLKYFDLSLRKFITAVDNTEISDREPEVSYDEDTGLSYTHPKTPVEVVHGSNVEYTLRVYNEGRIAGFAEIVSDDIPEGLVYLPEHQTNIDYKWKMYYEDEEGNLIETNNPAEATQIRTTYLSEENGLAMMEEEDTINPNLLNPFDSEEPISEEDPLNPDYRDIKVVFQVNQNEISEDNTDRIIINYAQISEDSDDDEDSIPDEWNEGEDDQDIEKIYIKEFDLSLLKWVTKTIVTVDGKTTTTETGFSPNIGKTEQTGENLRPNTENEPVAQVVIDKKKVKTTDVKFVYSIKVINEGELAGYATEITDYIPEGLKFVEEDNPIWTKIGENKITTNALETLELAPGESAELEVIFTWINDENNLGAKVNIAAITEDYNDYADSPDIDSITDDIDVQNYEEEQEDDDDYAIVVLTLKTGGETSYIVLVLAVLAIISTGILFIKRYVL